jgi:GNAT superfamily N-acetyltransferase
LVGYVALATDILEAKAVYITDGVERYKYAKYPAIKIARLAVDSKFEKRGIETHLLYAAIGKTLSICKSVGCRHILVDSKHEAVSFYKKHGFQEIEKSKKKNSLLCISTCNQ